MLSASTIPKHCRGVTSGTTPKVVSPTKPLEVDLTAASLTEMPRASKSSERGASVLPYFEPIAGGPTFDHDAVGGAYQGPDVTGPVSVVQASLERKKPIHDL